MVMKYELRGTSNDSLYLDNHCTGWADW